MEKKEQPYEKKQQPYVKQLKQQPYGKNNHHLKKNPATIWKTATKTTKKTATIGKKQ